MIITFDRHNKNNHFWDLFKQMFGIYFYDWDEADYGISITLFCHEWNWLIYKNKESYFEFRQLEYDHDVRYEKWKHDNT